MLRLCVAVLVLISLTEGGRIFPGAQWTQYYKSCKQLPSGSPSGLYQLVTKSGRVIEAFCEMGLNGGGYTFLHPTAVAVMVPGDVAAMVTDHKSALVRMRRSDDTQNYAVLSQLSYFGSTPMKFSLSSHAGYESPINSDKAFIGSPYLYIGFVPISKTTSKDTIYGFAVNGKDVPYSGCVSKPTSYIALFPNFHERKPAPNFVDLPICSTLAKSLYPVPSSRVMPDDFFMLGEQQFGGCACYLQTGEIRGTAIGFR